MSANMASPVISWLSVSNFLSIHNLEVDLPRGLVAFVGRNGSGKSNLLNALQFVLNCSSTGLGVERLADLQCNDVDKGKTVKVTVRVSDGPRPSSRHTITASLNAEGHRTFNIDDRHKTGKEVKCGASMHANTGTWGAATSEQTLIRLVKDVSGLTRWEAEAALACSELKHTRDALIEISRNMERMERGMAESEKKLAALARKEEIDVACNNMLQSMAENMMSWQTAVHHDVARAEDLVASLQEDVLSNKQLCKRIQDGLSQLQGELKRGCHMADILELQKTVTMEKEKVKCLGEELTAAEKDEREARKAASDLAQKLRERDALQREACCKSSAAQKAEIEYAAAQGGKDIAESLEHEMHQLTEKLGQLEKELAVHGQEHATFVSSLHQTECQLTRVTEQYNAKLQTFEGESNQEAENCKALALISGQLDEAVKQHASLSMEWKVGLAGLGGWRGQTPPFPCEHLHSCFAFKDPAAAKASGLALALDIIAGGQLDIIVTATLDHAEQLLRWIRESGDQSRRVRIWCLATLAARDCQAKYRSVQKQYAPGDITLPLDLITFHPKYTPVMLRAFGGMVIAREAGTAAALISAHGIPSVTLGGQVSRKGSLEGGWRGPRATHMRMSGKLHADELEVQVTDAADRLGTLKREREAMVAKAAQLDEARHVLNALKHEVAGHSREVEQLQSALSDAVQKQTDAQRQKDDCLTQLKAKSNVLQAIQVNDTSTAIAALQAHVEHAKAAERACLEQLLQVQAEVDHLEQHQMQDNCSPATIEQARQLYEETQASLRAHLSQLRDMEASNAAQLHHVKQQREEEQKLIAELDRIQEESAAAEKKHSAAVRAAKTLCEKGQKLEGDVAELKAQYPGLSWQVPMKCPTDGAQCAKQHARCLADLEDLKAEQRNLKVEETCHHELMALQERKAKAQQFRERTQALSSAVGVLEEAIDVSKSKVVEAHHAIVKEVCKAFEALSEDLLPSMELRCRETSPDNLQLEFCRRGGDGTWDNRLQQLSGGQRTLVSLAFLIAVADVGGQSSLFLMDEVDAALDEANQQMVAQLLKRLASSKKKHCQIFAVTHNPAFLGVCDQVFQITKENNGTAAAPLHS